MKELNDIKKVEITSGSKLSFLFGKRDDENLGQINDILYRLNTLKMKQFISVRSLVANIFQDLYVHTENIIELHELLP